MTRGEAREQEIADMAQRFVVESSRRVVTAASSLDPLSPQELLVALIRLVIQDERER